MSKRRSFVFLFALATILSFLAGLFVGRNIPAPTEAGVNEANFHRISVGMTLPEVKGIMGPEFASIDREDATVRVWGCEDDYASVEFQQGVVFVKVWTNTRECSWARIRRWLGFDDFPRPK
jgi:hypothetical protein